MRNNTKRALSWLLVLALSLSMVPSVFAAERNSGVRHVVATSLSDQAVDYYTDEYEWDVLSELEGGTDSSLETIESPLYESLQELMADTHDNEIGSYSGLTSHWPTTDTQPGYGSETLFYCDVDLSTTSVTRDREHVWPKSRASFYQSYGGGDLHHLRPTYNSANSTRSNYTMGNVNGVISSPDTFLYNGRTILWYSSSADLVEVNDNIKGDVARILLYVYVRWEEPNLFENVASGDLPDPRGGSDSGGNNGLKVMESLDTLLEWCEEDPVDEWEMSRNDRAQDVQGNRNVFIDYPELTWLLFDEEIPDDMPTPSGEGAGIELDHDVTIASNNTSWGTVAMTSTSRITATPAEGYYAEGFTVVPEGAATITKSNNTFSIKSTTADCTVTVQFAAKIPGAVSYAVPDGVSVSGGTASGWVGDPITLPDISGTPTDTTQNYNFIGWVDGAVAATADYSGLTVLAPGKTYTLANAQTTLYALYSYREDDGTGDVNTFELVTASKADWTGDYVMTSSGAGYVHLATGENVGAAAAAVALSQTGITKQGNVLTDVSSNYIISVSRLASGNYTMSLKGAASDTYLSYSGSGNTLGTATSSSGTGAQWTLSYSGAMSVQNVGTTGRYLQYNSAAIMFRCYTGTQQNIELYEAIGSAVTYYVTLSEGTPTVDKTALNALIAQCEALNQSDYTTASWTPFAAALSAAKTVVADVSATQTQVNGAVTALQGAKNALVNNPIPVDKTALNALIAQCEALNQSDYTTASWTPFAAALSAAKTVVADVSTTQTQVSGAVTALQGAKDALVNKAVLGGTVTIAGTHEPGKTLTVDTGGLTTTPAGADRGTLTYTWEASGNQVQTGTGAAYIVREADIGKVINVTVTAANCNGSVRSANTTVVEDAPNVELPFTDVNENHWFYNAVDFTYQRGLFAGTGPTTFAPDVKMTREMFVTAIARVAASMGEDISGYTSPFSDTDSGKWYSEAVAWGAANGLVKGYNSTTFGLGKYMTREQMAALVIRFADYMDIELGTGSTIPYADASDISNWAKNDVEAATAAGLFVGDNGKFYPLNASSRAQAAQLFTNLVGMYIE